MYLVSFDDVLSVMDENQFRTFILVAVIRNEDIHNFSVRRIKEADADIDGNYTYTFMK